MRVVINNTFGGFGLSHRAVMRYAELKGIKLYPWVDDISKKVYGNDAPIGEASLVHYTAIPEDEYTRIQDKERGKPLSAGRFAKSNSLYFSERNIPRDDPDLIKVVRELGKEANGHCAKLKIINIPKDIEYTIEEYDGLEHIAEKHRTWR